MAPVYTNRTQTLSAVRRMTEKMSARHYNLILLGVKGAGKSSTGNTILGRNSFTVNSAQQPAIHDIQKEMVIISGAHFNVYDVPGLYEDRNETQCLKQFDESHPTMMLLVIKAVRKQNLENSTKHSEWSNECKNTAEFIKILPKWLSHNTWLLFTRGDELERERITVEHIISQNEELKRLVEKLHNRYHVFNNMSSESSDQVIQLVKKIQEAPLQMPPTTSHFPRTVRPVSEGNLDDRRIILLGKSGAGKSATANTIMGEKRFKSMLNFASVTTKSEMEQVVIAGRKVFIVDTPGLFDTSMSAEVLGVEIGRSVYLSSPGPHAFLYVLPINSRFTKQEEDVVQEFEKMFGEEIRKYTIVLFTQGDQLEGQCAGYLIKMNSSLCKLVEQCGGGYHVFNNKDLSNREQVIQLMEKIDRMVEKNGGSCYCNQMFEDAARFKKEAEESRRRNMEGDQRKREVGNEKKNVRKETAMKAGKQLLEKAARFREKIGKHQQEEKQEVKGHKDTQRFSQEIMNESSEKAEENGSGVKNRLQLFELRERASRQNEEERKKQKEQRKEKTKGIIQDGDVRAKRQIYEKTKKCSEQEVRSCSDELTNEVKERSADAEKCLKIKMQIFENIKQREESHPKRRSLYEESNVKGTTIQKSQSFKINRRMEKHKESEQQECSRHNETPAWNVQMDRHTSQVCQENENQKTEQHQRQEKKRLVDGEYETTDEIYQNVEEITIEDSTTNTQATEDDPGLEKFLQQHSNHLSAAGQVSLSFRQKVAAGASAGCVAGASIGATVGIVLGPVGIAVGSAIGGFIGGVGGAVGGVFRAILK